EQYQRLIGPYQFAAGREMLLTRKGLGEEALYFYAEGNALVRLFPRSATQFASERGETLSLPEAQHDADLLLHDAQGQVHQARQVRLHEEEPVSFAGSGDHTLAGSLLKPAGPGPHPAVVLYHLANVHERDYYRIYARRFVQQGIAALIYDKRGHGSSTGEPLSSQIYDLIEDADAAFRLLQSHAQIDGRRIGLWGMSNGGWVDLGVAARHPEVAFVMNLSASGVPPSRQEQTRRVHTSRLLGAQPEQLRFLETFWERAFRFVTQSEWTDELETDLRRIQQEPEWRALLNAPENAWLFEASIAQIKDEAGGLWKDGSFDPAPLYAQLRCPLLCLWGEEDTVLPVAESMAHIQHVLQASAHPDWTVWTFPHANHLLYLNRPGVDEQTNEAMHEKLQDVRYPAGFFERMMAWASQRLQQQ
ncbi:MAG TPA: alpha/beta fold hydrolase, partial [Ktedonobacterales bacterium]|nr:alpha/beta fold hydrolase [Ktedonobacterales bacterium]